MNGLREQLDIDALLMGDLKSVLVDKRAFMSPRLECRLRFSVAHEIGHLILHRDIYAGLQHTTAAEWFDYISAIPEVEYGWVEWQAYEFAGRLLVPPDALREAFKSPSNPRKRPAIPTGWLPTKPRSITSPLAPHQSSASRRK